MEWIRIKFNISTNMISLTGQAGMIKQKKSFRIILKLFLHLFVNLKGFEPLTF